MDDITLNYGNGYNFLFYGKRYDYENVWLLIGDSLSSNTYPLTSVNTFYGDTVTGLILDDDSVQTINDNITIITIEANTVIGEFQINSTNDAGFDTLDYKITLD